MSSQGKDWEPKSSKSAGKQRGPQDCKVEHGKKRFQLAEPGGRCKSTRTRNSTRKKRQSWAK